MDQNNESPKIVFEDEEFRQSARSFQTPTPKIIEWVIEWVIKYSGGYVKDEKQASHVLIGFVVLAIIISLFLIFSGGSDISNNKSVIYQEDLTPTARATIPEDVLKTIPYKNAK